MPDETVPQELKRRLNIDSIEGLSPEALWQLVENHVNQADQEDKDHLLKRATVYILLNG